MAEFWTFKNFIKGRNFRQIFVRKFLFVKLEIEKWLILLNRKAIVEELKRCVIKSTFLCCHLITGFEQYIYIHLYTICRRKHFSASNRPSESVRVSERKRVKAFRTIEAHVHIVIPFTPLLRLCVEKHNQ